MSYTPKSWTTGDKVRTTDLNHMEQGIANAGSALIVQNSGNNTLDKTVQEIYDALESGVPVYVKWAYGDVEDPNTDYVAYRNLAPITMIYRYSSDTFRIAALTASNNSDYNTLTPTILMFAASSMSAYPTYLKWVRVNMNSIS